MMMADRRVHTNLKYGVERGSRPAAQKVFDPQGVDVYVPNFKEIAARIDLDSVALNQGSVRIPTALFKFLLSCWVRREPFSESAYLGANPDIESAYERGDVDGLHRHYVWTGWFEGRSPGRYLIDEDWYKTYYKDIALAVRYNAISDVTTHFNETGRWEGRAGSLGQLESRKEWEDAMR